jgi:uncharacterized Tic20 family protein
LLEDHNQEARTWGMLCHLSALLGLLLMFVGIPFASLVLPLIIWKVKKDNHPFIDAQGKESLNFQISMTLYSIVAGIISIFLFFVTCGIVISSNSRANNDFFSLMVIAFLFLFSLILVFQLVCIIFAAVKAYKGEFYRYPFTLRFLT